MLVRLIRITYHSTDAAGSPPKPEIDDLAFKTPSLVIIVHISNAFRGLQACGDECGDHPALVESVHVSLQSSNGRVTLPRLTEFHLNTHRP